MSINELISRVQAYSPSAPIEVLRRAYEFSARVHEGQVRLSGEPYLTHPLAVAGIIADLKLDIPSVATGLLHDTVEDTLTTLSEIQEQFGDEIAALVDGVTKISRINFISREERQAENFRKMVAAMGRDIRVLVVKLADRAHNMRTLGHLPSERQAEIAQETLDIYAPLAHRLGIYWLKSELEDNALRYLHPEVYYQLKRNVAKTRREREEYIRTVVDILRKKLTEAGIECEVSGRPKHFYSIYQKMQTQNLLYEQIYDVIAFRIITDTTRECYEALGVVHANWKPVPGRLRDYIALPKPNFYQSLHTTVIGPYGERMEVQIRTHEMHKVAEQGIAAHWRYKEASGKAASDDVERFSWLRQLLEWQQNLEDPQEFLHSFKEDLFPDDVFVFTPKGDLFTFPPGATVIDFAYRVHSEVGHHCAGARVNGRLVPLRYRLQNGDTVEIITTSHQTPSKDWLKLVKTPRALSRIRAFLKGQQRAKSLEIGREILGRDLSRYGLDLAKLRKSGDLAKAAAALGFKDEESLIAAVGYGRLSGKQIASKILPPEAIAASKEQAEERGRLKRLFRFASRPDKSGVRVGGLNDMLVRFGRCCDPLPGEAITGFVTRGRGVTVHTVNCPRAIEADPQRRITVSWDTRVAAARPVKVEVVCVDRPGLLAAMSKVISSSGVNITRAEVRTIGDKKALNTFEVMVERAEVLQRILRGLSRVKGVVRVSRMRA